MSRATGRSFQAVAEQEYHWTLIEYLELADAERIAGAVRTDERYLAAKLTAMAFNEPKRLWDEHDEARAGLLGAPSARAVTGSLDDPAFLEQIRRVDARVRAAADSTSDGTPDGTTASAPNEG